MVLIIIVFSECKHLEQVPRTAESLTLSCWNNEIRVTPKIKNRQIYEDEAH